MANTTLDDGIKIAEKFRQEIKMRLHGSKSLKITASFGVVEPHRNEDIESMLKRIDILLYRAKEEGRDRVISEID